MKRLLPRLWLLLVSAAGIQAQTVPDGTTYGSGQTATVSSPAQATVTANVVSISGTANVTFQATGSITLGNGFRAQPGGGGQFHALIVLGGGVSPPVITSATSAGGTVGAAFSYQITATNAPTSFGATNLPPGLGVNTTSGLISGTPTAAGSFSVSLSATNSGGTGADACAMSFAIPTPVVTSATSASGMVGVAFSYQITASNSPTTFGASGLPAGLSLNPATGVISGTPSATGTFVCIVTAVNSAGSGNATLTLTVATAMDLKLKILRPQ